MSEIPSLHFLGSGGGGMGLKEITSIYQTISISVRLLNRESEKEQVYDILELLRKSIT